MKRFAAFLWGTLLLLLGIGLLGWVGYNVFVERQESAEGLNPVPATVFGAVMTGVGALRVWTASRHAK